MIQDSFTQGSIKRMYTWLLFTRGSLPFMYLGSLYKNHELYTGGLSF